MFFSVLWYDAFHDLRVRRLKQRLLRSGCIECGDLFASLLISDEIKNFLMDKERMIQLVQYLHTHDIFERRDLRTYGFAGQILYHAIRRCSDGIMIRSSGGNVYRLADFSYYFIEDRKTCVWLTRRISESLLVAITKVMNGNNEGTTKLYAKAFYWMETLAVNSKFMNEYGTRSRNGR